MTIEDVGTFDFADLATTGDDFIPLVGFDPIPAGTNITFAYSSPAADDSANIEISRFVVFPTAVSDGIGDINGDGCINFGDIPSFVTILASGVFDAAADLNFDGEVTFADIPPFVAILQSI